MCLLIPGKTLHLNALLSMRKFRDRGNKAGAVKAFELLEEDGLGKVVSTKPQRGASMVCDLPHRLHIVRACLAHSDN